MRDDDIRAWIMYRVVTVGGGDTVVAAWQSLRAAAAYEILIRTERDIRDTGWSWVNTPITNAVNRRQYGDITG